MVLSNLREFIRLLSDERVQARVHSARLRHICKLCGNPAETFRTALAEFEYTISAICQDCQDAYIFSSDDGLKRNPDKKGLKGTTALTSQKKGFKS